MKWKVQLHFMSCNSFNLQDQPVYITATVTWKYKTKLLKLPFIEERKKERKKEEERKKKERKRRKKERKRRKKKERRKKERTSDTK